VRRDSVPSGDVAVAVRGLACGPVAVAGLLEFAASEPLGEHGPLVFGNGTLDLEQKLVVRVVGDRPMDEFDLAAGPAEFLEQEDLVGVAAGEPVGAVDGEDLELALASGVAKAVEGGAVEPRSGVTFINENMSFCEFMAVGRGPGAEGLELAVDGLVTTLLLGRHSGINGGSHDQSPHR
jgi:hypothetical protein